MNPMTVVAILISKIISWALRTSFRQRLLKYKNVSCLASIGPYSKLIGPYENLLVGAHSYINNGNISWGDNSKVIIETGCAIGYNVSIKAITHSLVKPTNNESGPIVHREKNTNIGNDVWIGDNVFIREGVSIGDKSIVGANSVVTKSFESNCVIAGVPARIVRRLQ